MFDIIIFFLEIGLSCICSLSFCSVLFSNPLMGLILTLCIIYCYTFNNMWPIYKLGKFHYYSWWNTKLRMSIYHNVVHSFLNNGTIQNTRHRMLSSWLCSSMTICATLQPTVHITVKFGLLFLAIHPAVQISHLSLIHI